MTRCQTIFAITIAAGLEMAAMTSARAQTFRVIHDFTGAQDGANPYSGLTMDRAGDLYGTAAQGGVANCPGAAGCGTVFRVSHRSSGWVFTPLYLFQGPPDGGTPYGSVAVGSDGSLYGTTAYGGNTGTDCIRQGNSGCGTVFNLRPPPTRPVSVLTPWRETVLLAFDGADGAVPRGNLVFDQAGNLYGTTSGNAYITGTAYGLAHSGAGWTQSILGRIGGSPYNGLVFDQAGNLYGTTRWGHGGSRDCEFGACGTVYKLSSPGWSYSLVYGFADGSQVEAGLVSDSAGNLYGATYHHGTLFELTPSGDSWTFTALCSFGPGTGPLDTLVMDSAGSLYGTTYSDGAFGAGTVFKFMPGEGCTTLHDFTGGSDGANPSGGVTLGTNGELYGTAYNGGAYGQGVIFEITP